MTLPPRRPQRSVSVPIRIHVRGGRIDGDRLRDDIAGSAGAQLARAFEILDEHGAWRPDLAPLEIRFTGAAAGLTDNEKRVLHARVGEGVARGARGAQARRGGGGGGGTKPRSPSPARETPKPQHTRKISSTSRPISTWHEFERVGDEVFEAAFALAAERWWQQHGVGAFPSTYGMLFRLKGVAPIQIWIVANGAWVARRGLTIPNWSTRDVKQEPQAFEPSTDYLWLEEEPDGLAKWRELARKRASKQRAVAGRKVGKVTAVFDTNAPQAAHSAEVTAAIDAYTRGWETSKRAYYWLKGVGDPSLIPFSEAQNPSLPRLPRIPVVALVDVGEIIEITEEDAAEGAGSGIPTLPTEGGGGRGADDDGGGGATSAGRGSRSGSGVTALPGQDVGEGGRGIVIAPESKAGGPLYPTLASASGAESSALPCQPYDGELSLDQLPTGGAEIRDLITKIATQLDMAPCPWPAHFCIQASRMIRIRASQIGARFEIDTTGEFSAALSVGVLDEDGGFTFRVLDSVAIQYLQRLAETIPMIRRLMELVRIHSYPVGRYAKHYWFEEVMDEATQACGLIWLGANQIMMQQLLNTSRHAVLQRKGNPDYARMFEVVCKTQLADQIEMIMLRTALERFVAIAGSRRGADAYEHVREHFIIENALAPTRGRLPDVRRIELLVDHGLDTDLVTRLSDETQYVFSRGRSQGATGAGSIVERKDGTWVIRASDGHDYSKPELDRMIQLRQQVVTSIDPLISQLLNRLVTAVRPLIDDPTRIPAFLDKLFTDMLAKNDEVSRKNRGDIEYAFEHGQIHRVDRNKPPSVQIAETQVWGWSLSGIHALAHTHVGVHFNHDPFYNAAVDRLIGQEYHWRTFVEDMIFVFGIALTIVCPPLGAAASFAANLALGLNKLEKAEEQETIYGALIDPEQVLNYAELQIELFMAKLQVALSFVDLLPGAGKGVKALTGLGRATARGGARNLARTALMDELERLAKFAGENFGKAFALELGKEAIEDKIVDLVVSPIIEAHIKELERELHEQGFDVSDDAKLAAALREAGVA